MAITAQMVKQLREHTGAGMMECKKALQEADGNTNAAIEVLRKRGLAQADRKAGRTAAEGAIVITLSNDRTQGAMVEVNCETDFVAADPHFKAFTQRVALQILEQAPADLATLMGLALEGESEDTVESVQKSLIARLGENIQIRRFVRYQSDTGLISSYLHGSRIGVLLEMEGGDAKLARDVCMHIAASRPLCLDQAAVPADVLEKEREILTAQAQSSGKPAQIVDKMVAGRLDKWLGEITLLGQPFVKDSEQSVGALLDRANARVLRFSRHEVGEGIEKKQTNFAEEVEAQVKGS
ncbi:translation elongation factor Ts [Nitrococcus mobilis]|uniref:Elongation factor Ts n=1 Tax=Nitrococcus mobilis Nb-231 TaxID=314278 RepID=A4BS23_9GAMM|nr:translation elongation factor Ts [Nitrococcus mobilis]EAR21502.1 elongation factor Ts [Nitrococcus mobilis Nb-231]